MWALIKQKVDEINVGCEGFPHIAERIREESANILERYSPDATPAQIANFVSVFSHPIKNRLLIEQDQFAVRSAPQGGRTTITSKMHVFIDETTRTYSNMMAIVTGRRIL